MTKDASKRILIVEDDAGFRTACVRYLELHGFKVWGAVDANDARRLVLASILGGQPFAAIVTDYHMPGMTGGQMIREFREKKVSVPIILMSAEINDAELATVGEISAFLRKPFEFAQLFAALDGIVRP